MTQQTVLLAHSDETVAGRLLSQLNAEGHRVVGPVSTAGMALALAAQTPATLAMVGEKLAGRRHGAELAQLLEDTWGIPSIIVPAAAD